VTAADWLYRSKAASVIWPLARLWLGYGWLNAGYQKAYAIVSVFLILAWRNAGYLGLDRLALPIMRNHFRRGPRTVTPVTSPPTAPTPVPAPAPAS
jgi:hypothetical protein